MLAVTIAAYLAGSSRRNSERISAREAVTETPPAHRLPSAGPVPLTAGGAQFAAEAGWVLETVELLSSKHICPGDSKYERFKQVWLFSFVHPTSGRIWDTSADDVTIVRRNPNGDITPTAEDAEEALNKAWAMLYRHLRHEEKDVR